MRQLLVVAFGHIRPSWWDGINTPRPERLWN
jgi:hypothetical protein